MTPHIDTQTLKKLPHVVVIGGGFAGLKTVQTLKNVPARITLIDKTNHHLFQPLLYQVATALLSPADIAVPIREVLRRQKNATVRLETFTRVDPVNHMIYLKEPEPPIPFDYLVLAMGLTHNYFGHDDWNPHAPGLKTLADATSIRARVLKSFEKAELETNPVERERLLTFVLIGGGPTGVEMAGAIAEMARSNLKNDFRNIDPRKTRVVLIEAGPRILGTFPESLANRAHKALQKRGVELHVSSEVSHIDDDGVMIGTKKINSRTVIWTAGVKAALPGSGLNAPTDKGGRVKVEKDCSAPGTPNIFVIGDAMSLEENGHPLPGVAQVAIQQGHYVGDLIRRRILHQPAPPPFHYRDHGNMAAIGRNYGIVDASIFKFGGFLGFLAWGIVHIVSLIQFRNRVSVFLRWFGNYVSLRRSSRLIIEPNDTPQ